MSTEFVEISAWNGYYDTYNTEPRNATELAKFSQLSYKKANEIFKKNKGNGKIEMNNNPASFASPKASDKIDEIIVSNYSITPQEMKNRKHNASKQFNELIDRTLNDTQILSYENHWNMLLDSIYENAVFHDKLKLLNTLKTIASNAMDKNDKFRKINFQNSKKAHNILMKNKGCMEYFKGIGFHCDFVNNTLKMKTVNQRIINTAIKTTEYKIELTKLYVKLNELWHKFMLLMQQNIIYKNQYVLKRLKSRDFINNYDDYYLILTEFTSISKMRLQNQDLLILEIISIFGFNVPHSWEENDLDTDTFACIHHIYIHVYNIENYKRENFARDQCMPKLRKHTLHIDIHQKEINEEKSYIKDAINKPKMKNRQIQQMEINNNPVNQDFYCICGDILRQQITINKEIICDSCLNAIETNNIVYHCDKDTYDHIGGFDICFSCVDKQNTNRVKLNHIQDQIQTFKNAFDAVSVNGVITKDRIRHLEQFKYLSDDEIHQCFDNIDTDNNGVIDFQEFCAFLKRFILDINNENNNENKPIIYTPSLSHSNHSNDLNIDIEMLLFTMFDDDANGIVDADELNIMLCTLGKDNYQYRNTRELIEKFDKNDKDGINRKEFEELLKFLKTDTSHDIVVTFDNQISNNIFSDEKENKQPQQQYHNSYAKPLEFHGWRKAYTQNDKLYYQNEITKQTSWSKPDIMHWKKVYTSDGQLYYQNDITKQTQWKQPIENVCYKRNINHFDAWTCNDLTEWICDLNINEQDKRKLIWGIIEMQLSGNDFISCKNAGDIIDTFEEYGIDKYVALSIWNNEILDILSKVGWKSKYITEWTCNELQGWILNLNLNNKIEQLLLSAINMNNICGEDFNEMKSVIDIIESFPDCNLDYNIGNKIYNDLENIRLQIEYNNNYTNLEPIYREPVSEFSKISPFEDKYCERSNKLNIAMTLCMKKLVYDLQCYIAKEIDHKGASKFDKFVGIYDSKNKLTKVINKLKKKLHWNNKLFKLFRSIAILGLTITMNFILPGASCICHFIDAAKHFYVGNTKKAFYSCALGVATIITAGFFDEIMDIGEILLNAVDDLDIIQSVAITLKKIIKGIARLLKPLLNGYVEYIKPFVDTISRKLTYIGVNPQLNQFIVGRLCKFRLFIDELTQANCNNNLDDYLIDKVNNVAKETIDECIKDSIGQFKNINEAQNHFIDKLDEKIMEFCWNEMKQICKDKGIKLKVLLFGNHNTGINMVQNNNINNDNDYKEKILSDEDIMMDKQRMIDEIGNFVKNISKNNYNNSKSEIKLFNKNSDTMIYISIKHNINEIKSNKRFKKKQYEYKATVHCIVMFAGNDEAKTQFLVQKLIEQTDHETPGDIK